ncbi:MAG: NAD(P)/FAD-dependent oxidoreductase [Acidobacteriia bacterium]|nr:NAD(P)/FAD-dependent oxidoreductase [Terriglobia bacterium]
MSPAHSESWGIVGGGVLGMTLALRLAQQGRKVTLLEGAPHVGGLASAWSLGDVVWDRHYHVTLLSDTLLRSLLRELDLEQEMQWVQTRTGFYTDGKLYSMSNAIEFLRFPPLGLLSKVRLAATIVYASRIRDWKYLEQIPVAEWLERWSGKKTVEKIWLPLLRAKLGGNYKITSAAFIWTTIARMYAARRTGLKKEMFGYVPGGYARILEHFHQALVREHVTVKTGHPTARIEAAGKSGLRVTSAHGSEETFDQVVVTTPAPIAAELCAGLSAEEKARLKGIQYQGVLCASVLLKKPLAGYYVTNITDSWVPFTAVIEMSALVDRQHFGGNSLVYLPKYLTPDDPTFSISDEEIQRKFLDALFRMYPHLSAGDVLAFRISRVRYVVALPTLGYSERLPPMTTSIPGLHIVNSAHIVNGTLNVNETVQLAERALPQLLAAIASPAVPCDP